MEGHSPGDIVFMHKKGAPGLEALGNVAHEHSVPIRPCHTTWCPSRRCCFSGGTGWGVVRFLLGTLPDPRLSGRLLGCPHTPVSFGSPVSLCPVKLVGCTALGDGPWGCRGHGGRMGTLSNTGGEHSGVLEQRLIQRGPVSEGG